MIKSGEKKEEYRVITDYWTKRLVKDGKYREFSSVTFSNGYAKGRDQFVVEFNYMSRGPGKPEWGAEPGKIYYIIHLGEIIT
jgi:hypothetical protein